MGEILHRSNALNVPGTRGRGGGGRMPSPSVRVAKHGGVEAVVPCVCGSDASAHPSEKTSWHSRARCTGKVSHLKPESEGG